MRIPEAIRAQGWFKNYNLRYVMKWARRISQLRENGWTMREITDHFGLKDYGMSASKIRYIASFVIRFGIQY